MTKDDTDMQVMIDGQSQDLADLPEAPADFHGEVQQNGKNYRIQVSNQKGYMAHVHLEADFEGIQPQTVFELLTNPNNAGVFRGVKDVGPRKTIEETEDGKVRKLEIEQFGEIAFAFVKRRFSTRLYVTEDRRDAQSLIMAFNLVRSDLLSAFDGSWRVEPLFEDGCTGTRVILHQDISPRGVPMFMKHLPLMGGLLRASIARAVCGVIDDINVVMNMVRKGCTLKEAIQERKRKAGIETVD